MGADLTDSRELTAAHGAQDAAGQMKTNELCQHIQAGSVDRDILTAADDLAGLSVHVLFLHQHGDGDIALIQGALNDLGAFRDKYPIVRFPVMIELYLRQARIDIQFRRGKICDGNDIWHGCLLRTYVPSSLAMPVECMTGRYFCQYIAAGIPCQGKASAFDRREVYSV